MKLVDKILVSAAGISIYGIVMIFFSGELSSENYTLLKSHEPTLIKKSSGEVVVYDKEIDEIIETYFKNIKENPDKLEEENRIIQENAVLNQNEESPAEYQIEPLKSKKIKFINYKVQEGDSLWRISQKYNVPVYTIVSVNPDKDKEIIRPGEELNIPNSPGVLYKIKNGDSLSVISRKYKISQNEIQEANDINSSKIKTGQEIFLPGAKPFIEYKTVVLNRFVWPISGKITSRYGMRKHPFHNSKQLHTGIDIGAGLGTKIKAAADGVVVFAGNGGSYGNMTILRHKDGYMSIYAHASSLSVTKGQFVKQGQEVAKVGLTGVTTGPHLHFEIKKNDRSLDPLSALKEKIKYQVKNNT
jgi:murein DD-endopeptidase MepM/ murein hydrolase activator NlpD